MKGLNALEIIFTLFVLIVVVLVVVRMFITRFTFAGIEQPIQDIEDTYNYQAAYSTCDSLCSKYESDCGNTQHAVKFCLQKANIDIDGNRIPGESGRNHYNVVEGIPMCEDGIYCFHIKTDCACGNFRLTPETCLSILCEYYRQTRGYSDAVTEELIRRGVEYGNCIQDVKVWDIEDYSPVRLPEDEEYTSDWTREEISYMGSDHWWVKAGYLKPCKVESREGASLRCEMEGDDKISCEWDGVNAGTIEVCETNVCLDDDPNNVNYDFKEIKPGDDYWVTHSLEKGKTYYVLMTWEGHYLQDDVSIPS